MDLNAAMGQFVDDKGGITLPPQLTLPGLSESLYAADAQAGNTDRVVIRYWDFSNSRDGELKTFTREQVNTRIKAVAARLGQVGTPGGRVAILANNSPEYLFGFLGAMYAGMIPVPLYDPSEPGHADHLAAVMAAAQPGFVLTNQASAANVRRFFADVPSRERPRILSVDALPDSLATSYTPPQEDAVTVDDGAAGVAQAPVDRTAFLQFTSGSTRTPAGVELTHRSVITNVLQMFMAGKLHSPLRLVCWLPLHHDMGILSCAIPLISGVELEIMSPRDFLQQPSRWIKQMSRRDEDGTNPDGEVYVYGVIPNFALELSARYGVPKNGEQLDLSNTAGLIIGSEPVTDVAITSFYEVFKDYGLQRRALRPSYGMAEASLLVAASVTENGPIFSSFDREQLAEGRAVVVDRDADAAVSFSSVGHSVPGQFLTIVDPETKAELADGHVGEIWTHSTNHAAGYLDRPEETKETFANTIAKRLSDGSRVDGAPGSGWLATGDLGVVVDGELYVTGRLKDLLIIAGRNHYPQDIEYTVSEASAHVRKDSVAAFSVEGADVEKLVLLVERDDQATEDGDAEAITAIRRAVSANHGLNPEDIVMLPPLGIKRSSAGKIARRVARKWYQQEYEA